jgi:hypothetical protein
VPPTSRKQQKYVFAQAEKGVKWAQKWVAEGSMKVKRTPKGKRVSK